MTFFREKLFFLIKLFLAILYKESIGNDFLGLRCEDEEFSAKLFGFQNLFVFLQVHCGVNHTLLTDSNNTNKTISMDTIRSEKRKPDNGNKRVIYIVGGIIAFILIAGFFFLIGRNSSDDKKENTDTEIVGDENVEISEDANSPQDIEASANEKEQGRIVRNQHEIDSLQRVVDSLENVSNRRVVAPTVPPTGSRAGGTNANGQGSLNLGYGTYEGPVSGGLAHGLGGTITFTTPYTIDLKTANHDVVEVGPGDQLINVKMENGRIVSGFLKRADGSQRFINIG